MVVKNENLIFRHLLIWNYQDKLLKELVDNKTAVNRSDALRFIINETFSEFCRNNKINKSLEIKIKSEIKKGHVKLKPGRKKKIQPLGNPYYPNNKTGTRLK